MISTAYGKDHALWDQIVRKETEAKKRFEFMTGETVAKKFYNGTNQGNVDQNLQTLTGTKRPIGSDSACFSTPQPKKAGRYNSSSKADALSQALVDVLSEKRSNFSSRRGTSTVCSKSFEGQKPLMSSTLNARTFRDVDSQADRYRHTIRAMQLEQMQCVGADTKAIVHNSSKPFPVVKREGVFDKNIKEGIKYADNKTKARKFELDKISQAYNPNRLVHVSAATAMIDPHITIRHEDALPKKDPRYVPLAQQGTYNRDSTRRVIMDYTGTPIIKVDQEGGIFDQQLAQGAYRTMAPLDQRLSRTEKQQVANKLRGYSTQAGGINAKNNFRDIQMALRTAGKSFDGVKDLADVDSTVSRRGLMQRKLFLMKMMLKNEQNANSVMKSKIGTLGRDLHADNALLRGLESNQQNCISKPVQHTFSVRKVPKNLVPQKL